MTPVPKRHKRMTDRWPALVKQHLYRDTGRIVYDTRDAWCLREKQNHEFILGFLTSSKTAPHLGMGWLLES